MTTPTELELLRAVYLASFLPLHATSADEQLAGWRVVDAKVRELQLHYGVEPGTKATGLGD